jgi:hypothetical protein
MLNSGMDGVPPYWQADKKLLYKTDDMIISPGALLIAFITIEHERITVLFEGRQTECRIDIISLCSHKCHITQQ